MQLISAFAPTLSHVNLRALEDSEDIAYAVDATRRIQYANAAWSHGATSRNAPELSDAVGVQVLSICSPSLQPFYRALYQKAATQDAVIEHDYSCPTPTHHQRFRMQLRGLPGGGVLVTHHRLHRAPNTAASRQAQEDAYRDQHGIIRQCAHCRLTKRADQSGWDWVAAFVETLPEKTSHGICEPCFSLYYPDFAAKRLSE